MTTQFRRGPTIGQIWVHSLAIVASVGALIGLIGASIQPYVPWRLLVIIGFAAAIGVLVMNTTDIIFLVKALRTETNRRLRPMWRIAINICAIILTVAGAVMVPAPSQGFTLAPVAFLCLLIAAGLHFVLFVWAVVDSIRGRRRRRNGGDMSLESLRKDDQIA